MFVCWACGRHSIKSTLIQLVKNTGKIGQLLAQLEIPTYFEKETTFKGKLVLPKGIADLSPPHVKYLERRNYDPHLLSKFWGVQGIGVKSTNPWRLFIPIHYRGEVVSWTTRTLLDGGKRYHSASSQQERIPHKSLLFGEDVVPGDAVILVEGPFDVFRVGAGAVSCFGTTFTDAQVERLTRFKRRVVCFDSQPEAQRQAQELCRLLSALPGVTLNVTINAKDPGSADEEEIRELRKLIAL